MRHCEYFMLIDLHVKTERSSGVTATSHEALRRAKDEGLDAVLFADELSTVHCHALLNEAKAVGITAFIGVEIPTDKGLLIGVAPQIDAFYEAEEWRQLTQVTTPSAESVIDLFHSIGGAVIAARPYDMSIPYNMGDMIFTLSGLHAVEVFNTRTNTIQNDFALEAASFIGVSTVGGSDNLRGTNMIGKHATFFMEELKTQEDLTRALRESKCWAVQIGAPALAPEPRQDRPARQDDRGGRSRRDDRPRDGGGGGKDRRSSKPRNRR